MATKNFKNALNQELWDSYCELKIKEGKNQMSINQYKPVILALEEHTNKFLSDVTKSEIESLIKKREGKNENHLRGFFITIINEDWITPKEDVTLFLLPIEYKKMINFLLESNKNKKAKKTKSVKQMELKV